MGNFAFNAHRLEDNTDRHEDNVDRHEVAATSTGEGVACTGRKTEYPSSCSASSPYSSSRIQSMLGCRSNFPDKTALVERAGSSLGLCSSNIRSPESDRLYFDDRGAEEAPGMGQNPLLPRL